MFKKINTKTLIVALIVLLGIYFIIRYFGGNDRSFKDVILDYNPSEVNLLMISDPQNPEDVKIVREGDRWLIDKNGQKFSADTNVVKNILDQVGSLQTKRYAGKGEEVWKKYEVTDSLATVVELNDGQNTLSTIYIGKFSYSMGTEEQQQQMMAQGRQNQPTDMSTYVRISGEEEVYAVDGFLKMNFNRDANSYRDKTLTVLNPSDITSILIKDPTGNLEIRNAQNGWEVNGIPADSAVVAQYMNKLENLHGTTFIDEGLMMGSNPSHQAIIRGNNFLSVDLYAYPVQDTNVNYAVSSTHNPSSFFNGKTSDLFNKVFVSREKLLGE